MSKMLHLTDEISAAASEVTLDRMIVVCCDRDLPLFLDCKKSEPCFMGKFRIELCVQEVVISQWNREGWIVSRGDGGKLSKEQESFLWQMLCWHVSQNIDALRELYLDEFAVPFRPGNRKYTAKGPIEAGASVVFNSDGTVSESPEWQRRRAEREGS